MIKKSDIHRKVVYIHGYKTVNYRMELAKSLRIDGMNETEIEITDENVLSDFEHELYGKLQGKILEAEYKILRTFSKSDRHIVEIMEFFREIKELAKIQGC